MKEEQKILSEIIKIIQENDDLEPRLALDKITLETKFSTDLGFDSLGLMSITYELQETYEELNEENISNWVLIKDLVTEILNSK